MSSGSGVVASWDSTTWLLHVLKYQESNHCNLLRDYVRCRDGEKVISEKGEVGGKSDAACANEMSEMSGWSR